MINAKEIDVSFSGVTYMVKSRVDGSDIRLLKDVAGCFKPFTMTAVMGPSGAGKSTLMDILSHRKTQGVLEGTIKYGGKSWVDTLRHQIAYVEQIDMFLAPLTVREMLFFNAILILPRKDHKTRSSFVNYCNERADIVLDLLALNKIKNTTIGSVAGRGISGGEARRLNLGLGILKNPPIVFADEPTSSLDSYTALHTIRILKQLSCQGKTIVASIHQPSQEILSLFDELFLLSEGYLAFSGPFLDATQYFNEPTKEYLAFEPTFSEILIDACSVQDAGKVLNKKFTEYKYTSLDRDQTERINIFEENDDSTSYMNFENGFISTTITLFYYRGVCALFRDRGYMIGQLLLPIIFAAIFASMWPQIGDDNPADLADKLGILFFSSFVPYFNIVNLVAPLMDDKPLLAKERADGMYSLASYYVSRILIGTPMTIVAWMIGGTIIYWACGLNPNFGAYLFYSLTMVVESLCVQAICQLMSFSMPNREIAIGIGFLPVIVGILFAGYYVAKKNIPPWWIWAHWGFPMKYAFEGLAVNEFLSPLNSEGADLLYVERNDIYKEIEEVNKWVWLLAMGGQLILMTVLSYLSLYMTQTRYKQTR